MSTNSQKRKEEEVEKAVERIAEEALEPGQGTQNPVIFLLGPDFSEIRPDVVARLVGNGNGNSSVNGIG